MGDRQTPLILVSSAMAIGSRFYRPVIEAFESQGWEAKALPRRGFEPGQDPASRTNDWSYADEADVTARAVEDARSEQPDRPVLVLGHSLGAQLAVGCELTRTRLDGIVTVAGSVPHFPDFRYGGWHLAFMGRVLVPTLTGVFGYVPPPSFGAPGPRTMMREWGRMIVSGELPFEVGRSVTAPSLLISLDGDDLAPRRSVDRFGQVYFDPSTTTRLHLGPADLREGESTDHIGWVRTPTTVVERVAAWWDERTLAS